MAPLDWMDAKALDDSPGEPKGDSRKPAREGPGWEVEERPRVGPSAEELLEGLNEPQRAAVTHEGGPLLILAGAGSGKTRVITRRMVWLLTERGVGPHEILAITFTNKAAKEMRERVEALVPARSMWICTFHAMCARILRREIEAFGGYTRDFTIYDTYDRNQLLKNLLKESDYDTTRFRPATVGGWISEWKTGRATGQEPLGGEGNGLEEEVLARVGARYEEAMRRSNALDFDDLLLKTLELFDQHPHVRDTYAQRFRFSMVDEYQDTNRVQYLLVRHLASVHGNLAVCGDPDQSIYAWRGADVANILDFERDFGGEKSNCVTIRLEQNYRSSANILTAAQGLIANNVHRKDKDLWTQREGGDRIVCLECSDENDEAAEIARQIRGLNSRGVEYSDMAIFYRVNFMQRALERSLRLAQVPYQIVGGVEFYRRREVRDLIGYLQLLINPADDIACRRVINVPARGIGAKSMEGLTRWATEHGVPLTAAAASEEARATIRGRARRGIEAFAGMLDNLSSAGGLDADEALEQVIDAVDYLDYLRETGDGQNELREENVEELRTHAATYAKEYPEGKLSGFLQDIALVSEVDDLEEEASQVALMTLHAAKGLEFPNVFIAGVEEELLPHARTQWDSDDEETAVEEERRLLYVGMTRAQERLFLMHAQTRLHFGETNYRRPSRFLDELPSEVIEGREVEKEEVDVFGQYEESEAGAGLKEGIWVQHDHFGKGCIVRLQGSGINARATVSFAGHGTKHLLLTYAKLRPIAER